MVMPFKRTRLAQALRRPLPGEICLRFYMSNLNTSTHRARCPNVDGEFGHRKRHTKPEKPLPKPSLFCSFSRKKAFFSVGAVPPAVKIAAPARNTSSLAFQRQKTRVYWVYRECFPLITW